MAYPVEKIRSISRFVARRARTSGVYAGVNIINLALGIAASIILLAFVRFEFSFDESYDNPGTLFRLTSEAGGIGEVAVLPAVTPPRIARTFPEILGWTRLLKSETLLQTDGEFFRIEQFFYADSSFFGLFSRQILQGDVKAALVEPHTAVLSKTAAERYFGSTAAALERTLSMSDGTTLRVVGVATNMPPNSHFGFDVLVSFSSLEPITDPWSHQSHTYLLLADRIIAQSLESKLNELTSNGTQEELLHQFGWAIPNLKFHLTPVSDIHLHSDLADELETNSSAVLVYMFAVMALLIAGLSYVNFVALIIVQFADRSKELAVRMLFGSSRTDILIRLLAEAISISLVAVACSVVVVHLLLPSVDGVVGAELGSILNQIAFRHYVVIAIVLGLAAALYPAVQMARTNPVLLLRGEFSHGHRIDTTRKYLLATQSAVALTLGIVSIVMLRQVDHSLQVDLGYEAHNLIRLDLPESTMTAETVIRAMDNVLGVTAASLSSGDPTQWISSQVEINGEEVEMRFISVDSNYINCVGLRITQGRSFSPGRRLDALEGIVVNETAARLLRANVGEYLQTRLPMNRDRFLVIGIVEDFHMESMRRRISPVVLYVDPSKYDNILIRTTSDFQLDALREAYLELFDVNTFTFDFVEDEAKRLDSADVRLAGSFVVFATLVLLIMGLGMFSVGAVMSKHRIKDFGIRRTLGADFWQITIVFIRYLLTYVAIGAVIAWPLAFIISEFWLRGFNYRIDLKVDVFIIPVIVACVVTGLPIMYYTMKVIKMSPVESLRRE